MQRAVRNLVVVLSDQLDHHSAGFDSFDPEHDVVWMAEVPEEAKRVWAHKIRIAFLLSAMRHFREELRGKGCVVTYEELPPNEARDQAHTPAALLRTSVERMRPRKLVMAAPGDYRVISSLRQEARDLNLELEIRPDRHFYCSVEDFEDYARGKKKLLLEQFYRWMRRRHHMLLYSNGDPVGGRWNFDADNRLSLKGQTNVSPPRLPVFRSDAITAEVLNQVQTRFKGHPGSLDHFDLPVTRSQSLTLLEDFVSRRLRDFGPFEDAMLADQPFLFHSRLSAPLNIRMLNPQECVEAAIAAFERKQAPINSVEGFVRQILGWREYIRGIYWVYMPEYADSNYFGHSLALPSFYWDGETEMVCVRQTMQHIIRYGYAHHIHRLMIMGNLALLLGVSPSEFHQWHMAMYVDAADWVSMPNTIGMSQYGDGGIVGSRPYCSTGKYIDRMSDFCAACPYDPGQNTGPGSCPFTTLYWEFLDRHYDKLKTIPAMARQLSGLRKMRTPEARMKEIRQRAAQLRRAWLS